MKVIYRTTITQIGAAKRVKPASPLWVLVNDGNSLVLINNIYIINRNQYFGIDVTNLLSQNKSLLVQNDTEFDISFGALLFVGYQGGGVNKVHSCQLIETTFEIIK